MDANFKACLGVHNLLQVEERTAANTSAGTFTSGAWRTRALNTEIFNAITGASLASNQVTIPAGNYFVKAVAPTYFVNYNIVRIQKISGSPSTLVIGGVGFSYSNTQYDAALSGAFTLTEVSSIELQHICSLTCATHGFGVGNSAALQNSYNVFSQLQMWKLS